ncbi:MAG: hypothetical protein WCT19_01535 [Candidatus Paceibacterota bacterium]
MTIEFNKVTWYSNIVAIIIFVGTFYIGYYLGGQAEKVKQSSDSNYQTVVASDKPENATFTIDNSKITLVNGKFEKQIPDSSSKIKATMFGAPIYGDLNGDGKEDAAAFLEYESGGNGTFYYAVAVINVGGKYVGTNVILLGDRVAPQTIQIQNGQVVANYAVRKEGEPMTTPPSIGVSDYLKLNGNVLEKVTNN